jgi:predicted 3-demethylubiquinone-9 3-methyltransferase (glyoxalase superfamily)
MQKITTFLSFKDHAEDAVKLYTSLFQGSRITSTLRYGDAGPGPKGTVLTVGFELAGQPFVAMNGGPTFTFAEGISLSVHCETQAEVDELWEKLTANGGKPGRCGWLTDRFGVSWQIVPSVLMKVLGGPDPKGAARAMQAMMQMTKLDGAALQRAYDG